MGHLGNKVSLITEGHWCRELEHIPDSPVPRDLLNSIGFTVMIDPEKSSTAAEALMYPYMHVHGVGTAFYSYKTLQQFGDFVKKIKTNMSMLQTLKNFIYRVYDIVICILCGKTL